MFFYYTIHFHLGSRYIGSLQEENEIGRDFVVELLGNFSVAEMGRMDREEHVE